MADNILMVSADRSVVAGEKGPFHYMLESFSRHWERVDVIGTRPGKRVHTELFGNVHLHHPEGGKLRQAGFIAQVGRRLASERRYSVITSHDYNPFYNGWGAWRVARGSGVPWVSEIHHVPGYPVAATLRERVDRVVTRRFVGWAQGRTAGFRVVNAGELPALLAGWGVPAGKVHVLPSLYLDLDIFTPEGPREGECDLLMVGRLVPNKGVAQVLHALARLSQRGYRTLRLRIVGRGPEQQRLAALAQKLGIAGQVEWTAWLPDAPALAAAYRGARALIVASTSEGGPRVAAEAMACGTPVVGTHVGLLPELIEHNRNGVLYDGRLGSLTHALQRLMTDAPFESSLRARLPGDLSRFQRETVIANLAAGLKAVAAAADRR